MAFRPGDEAEDMRIQNRFAGKPHGPIIRRGGVKVRVFLPNREAFEAQFKKWRVMSCTFGVAGYSPKIRKSETNVQHIAVETGIDEDIDIPGDRKIGP
ncbi:hypothetical protein BDBG_03179 [Blastomyces gilchristii SLH14081]|uniref:Uncharacterized protein n=1 Tax=Blastomyces gilchristii (strain SLH14081) TaxID=559298 RepID=A0A179UGB4_BLAGS|nr:uncharacterized protein BDBG_03179 [Blastomyces gilchristii SLH14081]OAT07075.1 hypothetical protein BDBG_03179 [Blastomyces gilchristii SLH14081]